MYRSTYTTLSLFLGRGATVVNRLLIRPVAVACLLCDAGESSVRGQSAWTGSLIGNRARRAGH